jgi:hypothetical protein
VQSRLPSFGINYSFRACSLPAVGLSLVDIWYSDPQGSLTLLGPDPGLLRSDKTVFRLKKSRTYKIKMTYLYENEELVINVPIRYIIESRNRIRVKIP